MTGDTKVVEGNGRIFVSTAGIGELRGEAALPMTDTVRGLSGILGLDPLTMGNEGVMLIAVPADCAERAVGLIRNEKHGEHAAAIGEVTSEGVILRTKLGGNRILTPLSGESLPRIC